MDAWRSLSPGVSLNQLLLCARGLTPCVQMFGPLVFREHALRLNTLPYDNTVNMDNVPASQLKPVIKDGLAYVPSSRHPYEYPLNDAYISFLDSGLRDRMQRWGRQMTGHDVTAPQPRAESGYSASWMLKRLNDFYDLRHEAVSNTRLIQAASERSISKLAEEKPPLPSFKVLMFTKNRLRSFSRCWESVRTALPTVNGVQVHVEVHVDFDPHMSKAGHDEYDLFLAEMATDIGPATTLKIVKQKGNLGLRTSILTSWEPVSNHEFAIFLVSCTDSYLVQADFTVFHPWPNRRTILKYRLTSSNMLRKWWRPTCTETAQITALPASRSTICDIMRPSNLT